MILKKQYCYHANAPVQSQIQPILSICPYPDQKKMNSITTQMLQSSRKFNWAFPSAPYPGTEKIDCHYHANAPVQLKIQPVLPICPYPGTEKMDPITMQMLQSSRKFNRSFPFAPTRELKIWIPLPCKCSSPAENSTGHSHWPLPRNRKDEFQYLKFSSQFNGSFPFAPAQEHKNITFMTKLFLPICPKPGTVNMRVILSCKCSSLAKNSFVDNL